MEGQREYLQKVSWGFIFWSKESIDIDRPNILSEIIGQGHTPNVGFEILNFWNISEIYLHLYICIYIFIEKKEAFLSSLYSEETEIRGFNSHTPMMEEWVFVKGKYESLKET